MESVHKSVLGSWKIRHKFRSFSGIFIMAVVLTVVYLTEDQRRFVEDDTEVRRSLAGCDLFSGRWVFDNVSYPLYNETKCKFMTDDYSCKKFGRKEFKFQNWRWQPNGCDLPRFDGTKLLEKLRNKRVVFVGDSLGKNQWVSLLCLIDQWITDPSKKYSEWQGNLIIFRAYDYNVSIDFYWEPLLVESNCDDPVTHRIRERSIVVDSIEKHAKHWTDADMLVFDSFMWWEEPNATVMWGSLEKPERSYVETRKYHRYEMALKTWAEWLDGHVNRTKTKLFFTSLSPYHKYGEGWGKGINTNCLNETEPITNASYWGIGTDKEFMRIAQAAVEDLKTRGLDIKLLNITRLSDYRKDGHPSIYKRHWVPPTEMELANPSKFADCVHWCLPGVPDVWNQILYSYILYFS